MMRQLVRGTVRNGGSGNQLKTAVIDRTTTGTVIAAATSPNRRIKVYALRVMCSAEQTINWRSGASTALDGATLVAAKGGYAESVEPPTFLFQTAAGESLDLVISGAGTVTGRVSYWDEDTD